MRGASSDLSCLSSAWRMICWISQRSGISGHPLHCVGVVVDNPGLFQQHSEIWDVLVPFDQGRNSPKPGKSMVIQSPDSGGCARIMAVDQHGPALAAIPKMAG